MKHKRLKNYLKFRILLFGIPLCLIGCQKDDGIPVEQQTDNRAFDLEFIQFNEFVNAKATNKDLLNQSIEKLNSRNSSFSRTTETNTFLIDSTRIAHIQHPLGYSSYSLPIISDTDSNILQNIIISQLSDGTELSFLAEYRTDVPINELDTESLSQNINGTKLTRLIEPTLNYATRSTEVCVDYIVYTEVNECSLADTKPIGQHPDQDACFNADGTPKTYISVSIETECTTIGGGGGNWPPTGYNPDDDGFNPYDDPFGDWGGSGDGGTGSGTGGSNPDENTNDNPCDENGTSTSINDGNGNCVDGIGVPLLPNPSNNDCVELKNKISDVPLIKTRLNQLISNIGNTNFEQGFKVGKLSSGDYTPGTIQTNNSNGGNHVNIRPNSQTTVIVHTHPSSVDYKMFSAEDILKMAEMANKVQNASISSVQLTELTHIVMFNNNENPNDPKAFALRFDDTASVQQLQNILNNPKEKRDFKKKLKFDYDDDNSGPPLHQSTTTIAKQQEHLFNLLDNNNLNISLYEANFDSNGSINDWQKINKDTLDKEPCN